MKRNEENKLLNRCFRTSSDCFWWAKVEMVEQIRHKNLSMTSLTSQTFRLFVAKWDMVHCDANSHQIADPIVHSSFETDWKRSCGACHRCFQDDNAVSRCPKGPKPVQKFDDLQFVSHRILSCFFLYKVFLTSQICISSLGFAFFFGYFVCKKDVLERFSGIILYRFELWWSVPLHSSEMLIYMGD